MPSKAPFRHYAKRWNNGNMRTLFIIAGATLLAIGLAWPVIGRLGLGRLPGDIVVERGNFPLYFPIVTSLLISAILMLVAWLFRR